MLDVKKRFTGFDLKIMALVFMFLDHIHYIFEFTNRIPLFFSYLGRLAGGLFLFTMVEGYVHTSDRKAYFKRIYLMGFFMNLIKHAISFYATNLRPDGFYPINSIFQTFTILIVMFKGIDLIREKKIFKGILLTVSPFLLTYTYAIPLKVLEIPMIFKNLIYILINSFIPSPFMAEGGIFLIILGLILYIFREDRKKQALFYFIFHLAWMTIIPMKFIEGITVKLMFTDYYEWIGAFSAILMLMYNGEKGRGMKQLFYIFYPAHIYILYIISILCYNQLV